MVSIIQVSQLKSCMYFYLPMHTTRHLLCPSFNMLTATVITSVSCRLDRLDPSPHATAVTSVHPLTIQYVFKPLLCVHQLHASFKCVCLLRPVKTATVASICDNAAFISGCENS